MTKLIRRGSKKKKLRKYGHMSRKKSILSDYIAMNYHLLKTKHPEARFIFLGDFNCFKPDNIPLLSPQLRQLVHYPTYHDKVLDLIVTDMHWFWPIWRLSNTADIGALFWRNIVIFYFKYFQTSIFSKERSNKYLFSLTKAGAASNHHQMWFIVHLTDIFHHNRLKFLGFANRKGSIVTLW